jgi:hypothetical protein
MSYAEKRSQPAVSSSASRPYDNVDFDPTARDNPIDDDDEKENDNADDEDGEDENNLSRSSGDNVLRFISFLFSDS